jgi:endonuclease YncB( thermonuclease family)
MTIPAVRSRILSSYAMRERAGQGAGTRPLGFKPALVVIALVCALAVRGWPHRLALPADPAPRSGPADIVGKAWVIDGDTVDVSSPRGRARVRLLGIDAPESAQRCTDGLKHDWLCGQAATRALVDHVGGRQLACTSTGLDRYRRVLAWCRLPDGSDLNAWLVREGWALAYGFTTPYRNEEDAARAAHRGIWSSTFVPPWEWRHRNGR